MRNKILIMTTVIIAISLILFAFLFFKNKKNSSVSSGTPTGSMILLSTKDSNVNVPVNNYYTAPAVTVIDEKDVILETNEDFDILAYHYNNERTFLIYLKTGGVSLDSIRQNAENSLIEKLGITKEQACLLTVTMSLANNIKGSTTEDYGLSFCPNGKPLPFSD